MRPPLAPPRRGFVSPALRSTDVKFLSARATAVGAAIVSVAALGAARDYPGSPDECARRRFA
jgi:hypothetical protein